ncbi:MAG: hypothetical protein HZB43_09070 [candidate division Zixibacteria bacterium]|nr:hypothetical protein [candidate division Zixibacteria bacterium]
MAVFRAHIVFGLILLTSGIVFDFLYLGTQLSGAFKSNPAAYLASWEKNLLEMTRLYFFVFGFLHIAVALVRSRFVGGARFEWTILGLLSLGSLLVIASGFWYAFAGPSFEWAMRCTVLTGGLLATVSSMALEAYSVLTNRWS